jgi:hypothetical protein
MSISSSAFLSYFQKPERQQVQELIRISTTRTSGSGSSSSSSCSNSGTSSGRSCTSVSGSSRRNSTNGTTVIQEAPQVLLEHSYLSISSQSDTTSASITTSPTSRSCAHEDWIKPETDTITSAKGIITTGGSKGDSPTEDKEMLLCKQEKRVEIKSEEEDGTIVKEDNISSKTSSSSSTTTTTTATTSTSPTTRTWLPLVHSDLLVPSLTQPPFTNETPHLHPPPHTNQYYSIPPYSPLPPKKRMLLRTSMEERQLQLLYQERQLQLFYHLHENPSFSISIPYNDTNQNGEKDDVEAAAISLLSVCSFLKFPSTTTSCTNTTGSSGIHDSNCNFTASLVIEDEEEGEISNICFINNHDHKNYSTSAPQRTHTTNTKIDNGPWKKRKHDRQLSTPSPSIPPSPISSHGNSSIVSSSTATTTATTTTATTNTTSQSSYYGTALSLPNPNTSSCILLNALPVSQWKGQRVEILTGPFQSHTGTVQRWKNGWITVQLQLDRTEGAVATTNASPTISSCTIERRQHDDEEKEEVKILHHPRRAVDLKVIPHDTSSQKSVLNKTSSNNPIHLDGVVRHSPIATVTEAATATTPNQPNPTNMIVVEQTTNDDTTKTYGAMSKTLPLLITSKHSLLSNTEPILTTTARPDNNSKFSTHDDILLHSSVSSASSVTISTATVTKANQEVTSLQKEQALTQVTDTKSSMSNNHDSNNSSHYKSWMATAAFDRPRRSIKKPQIYDDKYFEEKKRLLREAAKKGKYITTKNSTTTNSGGSCEEGSSTHEDDDSSNRS